MIRSSDVSARPLLIGGMHRSGTSLTASLLASAGLDIGSDLLGAMASNPMGHFEDVGFVAFHCRALVAQGLGNEGFTATAGGTVPAALEPEARDLIAARTRPGVAWGWKEPRTTLFLDFWQERIPDARHVFVFRRPWEVADSLFRRGDETFALNPAFALDVWTHYNRRILDFVTRHPTRCLVFEISQVIADPDAVVAAVRTRLDVPLAPPGRRYVDTLFGRDDAPTRATLVRALAPEAWRTYLELRDLAGSAADAEPVLPEQPLGACAVGEWARASRAAAVARETEARIRAETEARIRAEVEDRVRREVEDRLRVEAAERSRRRSPVATIRRTAGKMLDRIVAASRRLTRPAHRTRADAADLLPFPRAEEPRAAQRVA